MKWNASQIARAPGAMCGESLFRMGIPLAGADVPLNRGVELPGVEGLEPGTKSHQLARRKLLDGVLDVFGGGHVGNIAFAPAAEKDSRMGSALCETHRG